MSAAADRPVPPAGPLEQWPDVTTAQAGAMLASALEGLILLTAHQISLIDPVPGRNTVWAWLEQAVATHAGPRAAGVVGGRS